MVGFGGPILWYPKNNPFFHAAVHSDQTFAPSSHPKKVLQSDVRESYPHWKGLKSGFPDVLNKLPQFFWWMLKWWELGPPHFSQRIWFKSSSKLTAKNFHWWMGHLPEARRKESRTTPVRVAWPLGVGGIRIPWTGPRRLYVVSMTMVIVGFVPVQESGCGTLSKWPFQLHGLEMEETPS